MNNTPIFIKIDSYKEVLEIIDVIKAKIDKSKELLETINQLKAEEDEELMEWKNTIDTISDKVYFIDKTLFEPNI
jgi:hypothetical protein